MKRVVTLIVVVIFLLSVTACRPDSSHSSDQVASSSATTQPAHTPPPLLLKSDEDLQKYCKQRLEETVLTVSSVPNEQRMNGFGVEWDPHTLMPYNTVWFGDELEKDWALIRRRTEELGVQKVRMMILPGWYEPTNDNDNPNDTNPAGFTFDSVEFTSVLRQLEMMEELNIHVNLTIWGADLEKTGWLAFPGCGMWLSAPNDPDEYAENISVLLNYLLAEKRFTCIKELTLHNEPDWAFTDNTGKVDFDYYALVCQTVHQRLEQDGLRDRIQLILSDDTSQYSWLESTVNKLNAISDGYNSHNYLFNETTSYQDAFAWAEKCNRLVGEQGEGKAYTHNEFGGNHMIDAYHQTDTNSYERGVYYSLLAEAFLNAGSAGMLHWEYFDQYYNDGPRASSLMSLGLFQFKDRGWAVRPFYHAWGLIMRYTKRDSEVYPMTFTSESVSGTALKSPDGEWSYLITNSGDTEQLVRVDHPQGAAMEMQVYLYNEDTASSEDERLISSSGIAYAENGNVFFLVEPKSFLVATSLKE